MMKLNRSVANSNSYTEPFHKLMASQLKEMYSRKLLDAPAYVLLIVQCKNAAGWKWSFKVKDFCTEYGISKSAFYRAVSKLRDLDLLHWETDGAITVWHGSDIAKPEISSSGEIVPVSGISVPVSGISVPVSGISVPVSGMKSSETPIESEFQDSPRLILDNTYKQQQTNIAVVGLKNVVSEGEPGGSYPEREAVEVELRSLNVKLNATVRKVIATAHPARVQDAIAALRERISEGESFKCIEAAFVKGVKDGIKPTRSQEKRGLSSKCDKNHAKDFSPSLVNEISGFQPSSAILKF